MKYVGYAFYGFVGLWLLGCIYFFIQTFFAKTDIYDEDRY